MPWTLDEGPGKTRLTLTGQVDIFEAAPFHELLVELARRPAVDVDLAGCDDLDASAIQLLLAFRRASEAGGGHVSLTARQGRVGRLLTRFGLDDARDGARQT